MRPEQWGSASLAAIVRACMDELVGSFRAREPLIRAFVLRAAHDAELMGGAIGLGYVPAEPGESATDQLASRYEIEIAGERYAAEASLKPLYDPKGERVKV